MANIRDLAVGEVLTAPSPALSGTTLVLEAGQGADMPTTTPYHLLVFPTGAIPTKYNAEKVLVTARSTDTLTITRAQGETTAKAIASGWLVANALFAEDLTGGAIKRNQTPSGSINSSNTTFTVNDIYATGTLEVYLNGQRLRPGASEDYVETSGGFTMNYAPATGDVLAADYLVTSTSGVTTTTSFVTGETPTGTINGTNLTFTVNSPYSPNSLEVYIDGVRQTKTTDYTESASAGTFAFVTGNAPLTGSILRVNYMISGAYLISGSNSLVTGEVPTGTMNGTNALFTVLNGSYVASSLQVMLNGVVLQRTVDYVETSPTAGTFTMQTGYVPISTDILTVSYQLSITTTGNADTVDGYHASSTPTANTLLPLSSTGYVSNSAINVTGAAWSPTLTGFSVLPTGSYRYTLVGKMCTLFISHTTNGTSNSTAFTISLPFTAATSAGMSWNTTIQSVDNGTSAIGWATIASGGTVVTLYRDAAGNTWTASGNKRTLAMQIAYETA